MADAWDDRLNKNAAGGGSSRRAEPSRSGQSARLAGTARSGGAAQATRDASAGSRSGAGSRAGGGSRARADAQAGRSARASSGARSGGSRRSASGSRTPRRAGGKGSGGKGAGGKGSAAAGIAAALKSGLLFMGALVVAVLSTLREYLKAFAAWAGPRLVQLNRPLAHSPRRILELSVVPVVFIYYEVFFRLFAGSSLTDGLGFALLFALGYGLLVDFIASFLVGKPYRIFNLVVLFLSGLVYTIESIIYTSFQVYMTFGTILAEAGDVAGKYSDTLLSSILGGIPRIICFMLPCVLYFLYFWRKNVRRRMGLPLSIELAVVGLVVCLAGAGSANALDGGRYASAYEFDTATKTFGLFTSLRLDIQYSVFGNSAATSFATSSSADETTTSTVSYGTNSMDIDFAALAAEEEDEDIAALDEYVASLTASKQNEYTGIFEGKNVILICAEAFSGAIISEELTPTLYRMQHEGIYFSDYYQPAWGGSTSTGEFSFLMGLVPTNGTQTMQDIASNNNYFTIGNQLQRLGYFTLAFHNGTYDYYDRQLTHYNLGYDYWLGVGNGIEDITGAWVDDATTIAAMLDVFVDEESFCIYWMTLSGHAAYTSTKALTTKYYDYVVSVVGEDTYSDTVIYYLCYQMALEDAMTALIEGLEEAGIADDTVIVLTSDHYPYGLAESTSYGNTKDYIAELYGDDYSISDPFTRDKNALILWSGCLEEGGEYEDLAVEVSSPTYSLDILPTLSNMFGLEYDSRLLVGRDVFSDEEALVIWTNYSWLTERGSYNAGTGEYTWNEGYEYDEEYVERINTIVANKITFSKQVVALDYYAVLFGDDVVGEDGDPTSLLEALEAAREAEAAAAEEEAEAESEAEDDAADEDDSA